MVEAQQVQDGGVEVPHGGRVFRGPTAELVRGAVAGAALDSGTHQPAREAVRVVVAAGRAGLVSRHAAELGGPQHQRVGQQAALLQVGQQRRRGLIEDRAMPLVVRLQRLVRVPVQQAVDARRARGAVQVDVTHAPFQQTAGQQAVPRVGRFERVRVVGSVQPVDRCRLVGQFDDLGRTQLHLGRQLVRRDAGLQFGVPRVRFGVPDVQSAQKIPRRLLFVRGHAVGPRQVADRLLAAQHDRLMLRGQESVAPVRLAVGRFPANVRNGDVGWQILVGRAQRVADPRTRGGKTFLDVPRVHKDATRPVGVGLGSHRVDEGNVVNVPGHVRQQAGDLLAAFSASDKRPGTLHQVAVLALERNQILLARQRLATPTFQFGFVFPQIDLRSAAGAEDLQHAVCPSRVVRLAAAGLPSGIAGRVGPLRTVGQFGRVQFGAQEMR